MGHEEAEHVGLAHQAADVALVVLQRQTVHTRRSTCVCVCVCVCELSQGNTTNKRSSTHPLEKICISAGSDVSSDWGRNGLILLKSA